MTLSPIPGILRPGLSAAPFLAAHPEYSYLKPILKDMPAGPWTKFSAGEKQ